MTYGGDVAELPEKSPGGFGIVRDKCLGRHKKRVDKKAYSIYDKI
jgi:hypothetical protein